MVQGGNIARFNNARSQEVINVTQELVLRIMECNPQQTAVLHVNVGMPNLPISTAMALWLLTEIIAGILVQPIDLGVTHWEVLDGNTVQFHSVVVVD